MIRDPRIRLLQNNKQSARCRFITDLSGANAPQARRPVVELMRTPPRQDYVRTGIRTRGGYSGIPSGRAPSGLGSSTQLGSIAKIGGYPVRREYPILEFDASGDALINPRNSYARMDIADHCVPCFFREVIDNLVRDGRAQMRFEMVAESGVTPVYEVELGGRKFALFHPGLGGPSAAKNLEKVIALGCSTFIACGGAGVLDRNIQLGHLVIPKSAVRDEGTSYHYLPPSREVDADARAVQSIQDVLEAHGIGYLVSKTWTTDAFYRSTPAKIHQRKLEGCLTVEMECATFFAVAQFRRVRVASLLYGGDDLGSETWESRDWTKQASTREKLFWLTAEACLGVSNT